jgi:glutathione synthase/RimK-type ligase-like ATP-grasp enzyme
MILLCGVASEGPVRMVGDALDELGVPHVLFNQRHFAGMQFAFDIAGGRVDGWLTMQERDGQPVDYPLSGFAGVYVRLLDDNALPEMQSLAPNDPQRFHCRALHDALIRWIEIAPCRVVNRLSPMGSNGSKPYQSQLIAAAGFHVPETLITNEPGLVRAFLREHDRVIYKSVSSVRSIVDTLNPADDARLERIRWCPTQFQAFVEGTNVRVHVVGRQVFAASAETEAVDYRYAHRQGGGTELRAVELDDELAERCVELAQSLGLPFAGVDLKFAPDGKVYCFEVNPSPGFSYFEAATEQPISLAVARYLAGLSA